MHLSALHEQARVQALHDLHSLASVVVHAGDMVRHKRLVRLDCNEDEQQMPAAAFAEARMDAVQDNIFE